MGLEAAMYISSILGCLPLRGLNQSEFRRLSSFGPQSEQSLFVTPLVPERSTSRLKSKRLGRGFPVGHADRSSDPSTLLGQVASAQYGQSRPWPTVSKPRSCQVSLFIRPINLSRLEILASSDASAWATDTSSDSAAKCPVTARLPLGFPKWTVSFPSNGWKGRCIGMSATEWYSPRYGVVPSKKAELTSMKESSLARNPSRPSDDRPPDREYRRRETVDMWMWNCNDLVRRFRLRPRSDLQLQQYQKSLHS
jgi:hypothetical protein